MAKWLNDTEQRAWRALITLVMVEFPKLEPTFRAHDLLHVEYGLLVALSEAPGDALRMSDLAETANVSQSRLSHRMRRLVERGLIGQRPCTDAQQPQSRPPRTPPHPPPCPHISHEPVPTPLLPSPFTAAQHQLTAFSTALYGFHEWRRSHDNTNHPPAHDTIAIRQTFIQATQLNPRRLFKAIPL